MNLYKLTQSDSVGSNMYDSCVVCAASEADARLIHPQERWGADYDREWNVYDWAIKPDRVTVHMIGEADASVPAGVVCASYIAGFE